MWKFIFELSSVCPSWTWPWATNIQLLRNWLGHSEVLGEVTMVLRDPTQQLSQSTWVLRRASSAPSYKAVPRLGPLLHQLLSSSSRKGWSPQSLDPKVWCLEWPSRTIAISLFSSYAELWPGHKPALHARVGLVPASWHLIAQDHHNCLPIVHQVQDITWSCHSEFPKEFWNPSASCYHSLVLQLGILCKLESSGEFQKIMCLFPISKYSDLIGLVCSLSSKSFQSSPGNSKVQQSVNAISTVE